METNRVTPITHDLNVRPDILPMLMNGSKTVEVRTAKDRFTRINLNDTLKFNGRRDAVFNVLRIGEYESFAEMLDAEGTEKVGPGYSRSQIIGLLNSFYSPSDERLGVLAFELSRTNTPGSIT